MSIANVNASGIGPCFLDNPKFPEGLRILAVDDNSVCLKTLAAMLEKCKYHVTPMKSATEALTLLRLNKDNYDVVMTEVKMLDMDGFELLKMIGLEMDIPVIMMSVDDSTKLVMKGVKYGARDYLVKPIKILELMNIWQHVVRTSMSSPQKSSLMTDDIVKGNLLDKKRRGRDKETEDVNALSRGASSMKKLRFAWTPELHNKFVEAVHQSGSEAFPKKILEIMNEPELTREIISSHLQKYRNYLKKEQGTVREGLNYIVGHQNGIHEAYLNHTPASYSNYNGLPMYREASNGRGSGQKDGRVIPNAFTGDGGYLVDFQAMDNNPGGNGQGSSMNQNIKNNLLNSFMDEDDLFPVQNQSGSTSSHVNDTDF